MMGSRVRSFDGVYAVAVLALLVGLVVRSGQVWAQNDEPIGTVLAVYGEADVRAQHATDWQPLGFRDAIFLADWVRTGADSKVKVLLRDDSIMTLSENSQIVFAEFLLTPRQKRSVVNLLFGTLKVLTTRLLGRGSAVEVHTANTVAGVRGTSFVIRFIPPDTTEIFVFEGTVTAANLDPAIPETEGIPPNARTRVIGKSPPQEGIDMTPEDRQSIQDAVRLIEQVPEEVTPTDQQEPQRDVRGAGGPTPPPASAIVDMRALTPLIDVPQGLETLIEASVPEAIKQLTTTGSPTEAFYGPDETPQGIEAVEESLRGDSQLIIELPKP